MSLFAAEQDDVGHAAPEQDVGGAQDAFARALGQDDALAVAGRLVHQGILEHLGRDPGGPLLDHPVAQLGHVDVLGKAAQRGGDALRVAGFDAAVQGVELLHGLVGVALGGQHRDRHAGPALDELVHVGGHVQAAGEHDAGDVRVGAGKPGGQGGQDDVRPVAGGDDQGAGPDVFQEVPDLHGGHQVVVHQRLEAGVAVEHVGVEPAADVVDGRLAQLLVLGDDVDGQRVLAVAGIDVAEEVRGHAFGGAVDHAGQAVHALFFQGVQGGLGDVGHLVLVLVAARGDHQHGRADVGRDVRVEVELEGRVLALEVGALAQDEVVLFFQRLEFVQYIFKNQGVLAGVDQLAGLFERVGVGVVVGDGQLELVDHQRDVVVQLALARIVDDGAEDGDVVQFAQQHLHDAEDHGGLAAAFLSRAHVQVVGHDMFLSLPAATGCRRTARPRA